MTVWRLDGGSGSEEKLRWLMQRDYHLVAKGMNHHRAHTLAKLVERWDDHRDISLGEVPGPHDYPRPVRLFVKRRQENGRFLYNYYVTTLSVASKRQFLQSYDARGAAEVEQFRNDKQGLGLAARRKRSFLGQKAFVLLTDLAHNLLADFYHKALIGSKFEAYGPKRIVRDLLCTSGLLSFDGNCLTNADLLSQEHFSSDLVPVLLRYISD